MQTRLAAAVLLSASLHALVLSAVGLYGVIATGGPVDQGDRCGGAACERARHRFSGVRYGVAVGSARLHWLHGDPGTPRGPGGSHGALR